MSYLIPVTRDLAEARQLANCRGGGWLIRKNDAGLYFVVPRDGRGGGWLIRKNEDGLYFVVPKDDRGFDGLGSLVEIVRSKRRIATKSLV